MNKFMCFVILIFAMILHHECNAARKSSNPDKIRNRWKTEQTTIDLFDDTIGDVDYYIFVEWPCAKTKLVLKLNLEPAFRQKKKMKRWNKTWWLNVNITVFEIRKHPKLLKFKTFFFFFTVYRAIVLITDSSSFFDALGTR